jgi:hypothetical protein
MVRNYALALANVTFRIDLHGLLWLGMDVSVVYDVTRALQPVQNLIIAEVLIHTRFFDSMSWTRWWNAISRLSQPAPKTPDDGQPPELSSDVPESRPFCCQKNGVR